ncbi:MAG: hypothetical protein M3O91_07910, partial [Chloroflexota bacterium]|nr:hypothetical protein [Chloroflexota bacterium]
MLGLLFTVGARTPLVALLAFRRRRNLVGLVLPEALFVIAAVAIGPAVSSAIGLDLGVGIIALTAAPGLVRGDRLADALGGSRDTAAALFTGTLLMMLVIVEPALRRVAPIAGPGVGG